jgi:hypothetical protein
VKEILFENYISVTKYEINNWEEITLELEVQQYIENGESCLTTVYCSQRGQEKNKMRF